jgi:hypothetical protein
MRTGGFEVGRIALRDLMNVEGVFAGRKIFDVQRDFDALRRARKYARTHTLAVGVFELDRHRLGS